MGKKLEERTPYFDPRIIYISLVIIVILAIYTHLNTDETVSIIIVFLIVIMALGNIGYLYSKRKKRAK